MIVNVKKNNAFYDTLINNDRNIVYAGGSAFKNYLMVESISGNGMIFNYSRSGKISITVDEFVNNVGDFRLVMEDSLAPNYCNYTYWNGDSSIEVFSSSPFNSGDGNNTFIVFTKNKEVKDKFIEACDKHLMLDKRGSVYCVMCDSGSFYLSELGIVTKTLERDNYTDDVVKSYDHVIKNFASEEPFGRLVVINGPPGTGKTHFIKGMINQLKGMVVLVPPRMISDLGEPGMLKVFSDNKKENNEPVHLIIEDADACLATRMGDNISEISSLLNQSDGIMGSLLDMRIIATTNQSSLKFDEALVRPGRLCKHIEIDLLEPDKANSIYRRLTDSDEMMFKNRVSLSDVYAESKGARPSVKTKKSKVGFNA